MCTKYLMCLLGVAALQPTVDGKSVAYPVSDQSTLIVGGKSARQGQFPYQLEITAYTYDHLCGAALVEVNGTQVAITAAHCLEFLRPEFLTLVAGEHNRVVTTIFEQRRTIKSFVQHPNYQSLENDIAVVFLNESYTLNNFVKPIPLPQQNQTTEGNITVSGWGLPHQYGDTPNILQYTEIPVMANYDCAAAWERNPELNPGIIPSQLCAFDPSNKTSTCNGDSGGPAANQEGELVGLVSWGFKCNPEYPAVFTRVSHYINWIESTVALHQSQ